MMTEKQAELAGKLAITAENVVGSELRHGGYRTLIPIEQALAELRLALGEYNKEMGVE